MRFVNQTERELYVETRAAGPVRGTGVFALLPARTLVREVSAPYPPATFSVYFRETATTTCLVDETDPANRRTRVTLGNLTRYALKLRVNGWPTELRPGRGHIRDVDPAGAVDVTIIMMAVDQVEPQTEAETKAIENAIDEHAFLDRLFADLEWEP